MAELFMVEAINDGFHVELARDDERDGHGRGRRPRRRRLPRDRRAARQVRREPLRRHAARRGRDPRQRDRALHGGLEAGLRDAVRRVLVSVPRPADHPRRPLPLAHRREDGVPARHPHAVRRRRARARAARRLARGVLRPHAGREGRDPVDARRREGPARGGDPRPGSRRDPRAEAHLPRREAGRSRGRVRRPARAGAARARGDGRDARRVRRDGSRLREARRTLSPAKRRWKCSTSARSARSTRTRCSPRRRRRAAS